VGILDGDILGNNDGQRPQVTLQVRKTPSVPQSSLRFTHEVKLSAFFVNLKSNDESTQRSQRPHVTGQWESTPSYLQNFKIFPLFLICLHFFEILLPLPSSVVNWNLLSSQKVDGVEDGLILGNNDGLLDGLTLGLRDGREDGTLLGTNDGKVLGLEDGADDGVVLYLVQ